MSRLVLFLSLLAGALPFPAPADAAGDPERGKVVFALAAGCGCHTGGGGEIGAGGGTVPTPFGTFYGTNITSDRDTGLGDWSDAEIDAAIRRGVRPDGSIESPAMPYYLYAGMSDEDTADLIAYLRTLPAVHRPNRPHDVKWPFPGLAYRAWRLLFVRSAPAPPRSPASGVERGRYLAEHVSLCVECHTPRTALGVPNSARAYAGMKRGPDGTSVPNITPHATGIGDWDAEDIYAVLTFGRLPNFDNVQGWMAKAVDGVAGGPGYKHAPEADRRAIAAFLRTLAPIDNAVNGQ